MKFYVTLDVDGTLCPVDPCVSQALMEYDVESGLLDRKLHSEMRAVWSNYYSGGLTHDGAMRLFLEMYARGMRGVRREDALCDNRRFLASAQGKRLFYRYVKIAIERFKGADYKVLLVTSEPDTQAEAVRSVLGADGYISTQLGVDGEGKFDGSINRLLASAEDKMTAIMERIGDDGKIVAAFGDTESDRLMLRAAEHAVLVGGKNTDAMREEGKREGWLIAEGTNKRAILGYVEGILMNDPERF